MSYRQVPRQTCLSGQTVNDILKSRAGAAGFDPATISGHSLRRGFATSAAENGVDVFRIQAQTGHKSVQMLSEYVAVVDAFERGSGKGLL